MEVTLTEKRFELIWYFLFSSIFLPYNQAKCGVREGAKTESSGPVIPTGGPRRGPPVLPLSTRPPFPPGRRSDPYMVPRRMSFFFFVTHIPCRQVFLIPLVPFPIDPRGIPPLPLPLLPPLPPHLRAPYLDPVPLLPKNPSMFRILESFSPSLSSCIFLSNRSRAVTYGCSCSSGYCWTKTILTTKV